MNRYRKPIIGALVGASTAGGWLIMDILLPTVGDYLLFSLMAIVNAGVGWQFVRMLEKKDTKEVEAEKLTTKAH